MQFTSSIARVTESNAEEWDSRLTAYGPRHAIFSRLTWYSQENAVLVTVRDPSGELVGGFPFCVRRRGIRFGSLPGGVPYGGPITMNVRGLKKPSRITGWENGILASMADRLRREFHIFRVRAYPEATGLAPFRTAGFRVDCGYTYRLALGDPSGFAGEHSTDIRKAERDGLVFHECTPEAVFGMVDKSYARQGRIHTADLNLAGISAVASTDECLCGLAVDADGHPIAGALVVLSEDVAYYLYGGYDSERSHRGAGPLVLCELASRAADRGVKVWDFEGSSVRPIAEYFRKFGARWTVVPRLCLPSRLAW
jgi:hypothetical protein